MWRKGKKMGTAERSVNDKAATGIAKLINGMQRKFGETLNKKTAKLTQRGKVVLLVGFCIVFGGGSIYIMVDGMRSSRSSSELLNSKSIAVPSHVDKTGDLSPDIKAFITAEDIRKIQAFRRYMDSLKTTKQGLLTHDSIIHARPGLMDSLAEVEWLYGIDSAAKN
jgi:hypothetical protein